MKNIFLSTILLCSLQSYAQSWNGIPISGTFENAKINLINKGFILIKSIDNNIFIGNVNGVEYSLIVDFTPISKMVAGFLVLSPEMNDWIKLKTEYLKFKNLFTDKYGNSNMSMERFQDPYKEGDGNEMLALVIDKCLYTTIWEEIESEPNLKLGLSITKLKKIIMYYENKTNTKIKKDEQYKIDKNTF
jgi:hypothetical protein